MLPAVFFITMGLVTGRAAVITLIWTFAEMCIGSVAGAYFYSE